MNSLLAIFPNRVFCSMCKSSISMDPTDQMKQTAIICQSCQQIMKEWKSKRFQLEKDFLSKNQFEKWDVEFLYNHSYKAKKSPFVNLAIRYLKRLREYSTGIRNQIRLCWVNRYSVYFYVDVIKEDSIYSRSTYSRLSKIHNLSCFIRILQKYDLMFYSIFQWPDEIYNEYLGFTNINPINF